MSSVVYTKTSREFADRFIHMVRSARSVCITSHKCDDDSISSILALYSILREKFSEKPLRLVVKGLSNERWRYLKGYDKIEFQGLVFSPKHQPIVDLIIFVDTNTYRKYEFTHSDVAKRHDVRTICIDHHESESEYFDLALIDPSATSVAELVYFLFCNGESKISFHLSQMLLLGIFGDTLNLQAINSLKAYVFDIIRRLVSEHEIDLGYFLPLWRGQSERVYRIIKEIVNNGTIYRIGSWPPFLMSYVTRDFMASDSFSLVEADEAAGAYANYFNMLMSDVRWIMVFSPVSDGGVRMRLRSQPGVVNARAFVESFQIGGGHSYSASGLFNRFESSDQGGVNFSELDRNPIECFKIVTNWMKTHDHVVT